MFYSAQPEAAIWCALSWTVVLMRVVSRCIRLGDWRRLHLEDACAVTSVLAATAVMVLLDGVEKYYPSPAPLDQFVWTSEFIRNRTIGAKLFLAAEHAMIVSVWVTKAGLLLMYYRLTELTNQRTQVILTAIYAAVAFIVLETLLLVGWCRPFSDFWAMIPDNDQCMPGAMTKHYMATLVTNISSDVLILMIPLPLLWKRSGDIGVRSRWKTRLILFAIFALGCFAIYAGAASRIFILNDTKSFYFTSWYVREVFTAVLCANLPRCTPVYSYAIGLLVRGYNTFRGKWDRRAHVELADSGVASENPSSNFELKPAKSYGEIYGLTVTQTSSDIEMPEPARYGSQQELGPATVYPDDH